MKLNFLISRAVHAGAFMLLFATLLHGAEPIFHLSFDGKTLTADQARGEKKPIKPIELGVENFIPGVSQGDAFVRTRQEWPTYTANQNVNFEEGTVSFWFKPINWIDGKPARFLHIYSPVKGTKDVLIFYFMKRPTTRELEMRIFSQLGETREMVSLIVPADAVNAASWQKVDLAWDERSAVLYFNGEKVEEKPMVASFAEQVKLPRDWSSLGVLPVITSDGDDWDVRTAIDDIVISKGMVSAAEARINHRNVAGAAK